MKVNLLIMLLLSLYYGCAKPAKTVAKFNLKSLSNLGTDVVDIGENGVVIFGRSDNGHRFAKVMNAGDNFDYELDNGNWTFKAIAWDEGDPTAPASEAPGDVFTGTPSCAVASVPLNGSEISISLPLKNADCANADFSANGKAFLNGALQNFYPLNDIYSCDESVGDGSTVSWGDECINDFAGYAGAGGDDSYLNRGYHSAYKVVVRSFYAGPSGATLGTTELSTACFMADDTAATGVAGLATAISLQIPSGSGMSFAVKAYYDDTCSGRFNEYLLSAGLGNDGGKIGIAYDGGAEAQKLYLKSYPADVCQGTGLTAGYAGGKGTNGKPYLICTANQLNEIYGLAPGATAYTKNYRLVRDIDMNTSTYHQDNGNLITAGMNAKPFGFLESDIGTDCSTAFGNTVPFTGKFDGGGNIIRNLKIEAFRAGGVFCDNAGFFSKTDTGAGFARLKFDNAELHDSQVFAGILAGSAFDTNIFEIGIQNSTIYSDNTAGTVAPVFGDLTGTSTYEQVTLNNVTVDNTESTIATLPGTISGRCEDTGVISVNGPGITSGPYTNVCTSGGFNISGVNFTAGNGVKEFTITHANGNTVVGKYDYASPNPTVVDVYTAKPDGTYTTGEVIDILIQFSEIVNVTGTPQLALNAGGASSAGYFSGSGSDTLTFRYTVAVSENSADLDYQSTTALTLSGGTIENVATNTADLTLPTPGGTGSISDDKAVVINTGGATANITSITSTAPGDGSYTTAQVIDIIVTFDAAVTTSTSSLSLDSGGTAIYLSGSGTTTITYRYTVAAAENSADLNVATFNIGDANANATIPGGQNLADNQAIIIDTMAPTITQITSTKANGAYTVGEALQITVTFSENVTNAGGTSVNLDTGGSASFVSGGGTIFHVFNYTVAAAENSTDLTATIYNAVSAADAAGNLVDTTLPAGNNIADLKDIVIDTTVPTVGIDTPPHINASNNTSYTITGTCSENGELVNVDIGGLVPTAPTCTAGVWTISGFDVSGLAESGDPAVADVIITADHDDAATNSATQASFTVIKDTIIPTVSSVQNSAGATATEYRQLDSDVVTITVNFSEVVDLQGTADIMLDVDSSVDSATATSSTSGLLAAHDFDYVVGRYQVSLDLDYISSSALTIGGSITDPAGNTLNPILPDPGLANSLSDTSEIIVLGSLPFDSIWDTDLAPGISGTGSVQLPLDPAGTYNFIVEWAPGVFEHVTTSSHPPYNYGGGIHTVRIYGKLSNFKFNDGGDKLKITSVPGLGNVGWETFERSFNGCTNLVAFDGGGGDTSEVTSMSYMFAGATNVTPNTTGWITSNVTDMSYMFFNASSANPNVGGWDVSNVTNMERMFSGATVANPDVSMPWDVSNVTNMVSMFSQTNNANPDVSMWNVSNVVNMSGMFKNATAAIPNVTSWTTTSVTNISFMFDGATSANPVFGTGWDTINVTDMRGMFNGATLADPDLSNLEFNNVTNMTTMFTGSGITTPNYDILLNRIDATTTQTAVTLDAGTVQYTTAVSGTARGVLTGTDSWVINDGGGI